MTMNKSRSMVNASGGHVCDLVIQICLESHSLLKLTNYLWKLSGWVMADLELDQIVDVHQLVTDNCQVCWTVPSTVSGHSVCCWPVVKLLPICGYLTGWTGCAVHLWSEGAARSEESARWLRTRNWGSAARVCATHFCATRRCCVGCCSWYARSSWDRWRCRASIW